MQKSSIAENHPLAGAECADPFMASRCAGPLVGARFLSQVDVTQQAAFLVEGFDRYEEALQPFEVFLSFDCDEGLRSLGSGFVPAFSDALSIRVASHMFKQAKARCLEQAFIFGGRAVKSSLRESDFLLRLS
jgi:hypothetical protein